MNPRITKPETNTVANLSTRAFMISRNNPNVIIVIGKVRILSMNPIVALTKPITIAREQSKYIKATKRELITSLHPT
jgi:hypothetical protein